MAFEIFLIAVLFIFSAPFFEYPSSYPNSFLRESYSLEKDIHDSFSKILLHEMYIGEPILCYKKKEKT